MVSSEERRTGGIAGQLSLFDNPSVEKSFERVELEIVEVPKKSRRKKTTLKEQFKDIPTRQVSYPLKIKSVIFAEVKCWKSEQM